MAAITPALLRAYRETGYHVEDSPPFVLRIGEASAALKALHERYGVGCSTFITAANPHSQSASDAVNAARTQALADQLTALDLPFIEGAGRHPRNGWSAEASFLVLGLARQAAERLGRQWTQNAIVWSASDAVPRLVLLR